MDNCTLVNKLLRWHEPLAWPARGNSGCLEFVCKKLLLYVSGISEQIVAKTLPIFFIENIEFGVILIFVTLDVVIQIFYRFVLFTMDRESLQGWAPHWSGGSLVVTRSRWGHNARVRCGPQIIYICEVISAQLSDVALTISESQNRWELSDHGDNMASVELAAETCSDPVTAAHCHMSQHYVWSPDPGDSGQMEAAR